jgi:hypothetical protein
VIDFHFPHAISLSSDYLHPKYHEVALADKIFLRRITLVLLASMFRRIFSRWLSFGYCVKYW